MGRRPLLTLAAATALACGPSGPAADAASAHAGLACAECHQGGLADRPLPAVPSSTCLSSGCHRDDVPQAVSLATVRFQHRDHGVTGDLAADCAGCHTHASGAEPLDAGTGSCGLCHAEALSGARVEDCRTCHGTLEHAGVTSQGVEVPHEGLPWIEGGCLRCHYTVARPVHEVDRARCAVCHDDVAAVTRAGIGIDLHPTHTGSACASCHEEDTHRIEAMSSAVDLDCADCHAREHEVPADSLHAAGSACSSCHEDAHRDAQRLLLGILPDGAGAVPSNHFTEGLTCRSCHVGESRESMGRASGPASCTRCHRPEYATVLRWWSQGIAERLALVDRYVAGIEDPAGGAAPSRARVLLARVVEGRGEHNLPLTHQILEQAVAAATDAYRMAGREPPPAPVLGRAPRPGLCSYCHYTRSQAGFSAVMDDAFHREVLRLDVARPGGGA